MVAGATDDTMAEPMYGGFCLLDVMTRNMDNPQGAMRPFDKSRDGFVLGEGAAFLVPTLGHYFFVDAVSLANPLGAIGWKCTCRDPEQPSS